jgi:hypothetical protein
METMGRKDVKRNRRDSQRETEDIVKRKVKNNRSEEVGEEEKEEPKVR